MCKLNEKFEEWRRWYTEADDSVCAQISDMLFDSAIFNTINEAKKYAITNSQGNPELNSLVHGLIDRSFLKTQSLAIRKLCDKRNDVISLRRLINDMQNNKSLTTRANILSVLGFPYDYEKTIKESFHPNDPSKRFKGHQSEIVHKNIDLLAGVKATQRSPSDTAQDSVFERLDECLDKCRPIVDFVNKTIAHTATLVSKGKVPNKNLTISLAKIYKAHCRIVRAASFIGQVILYESYGLNSFPAYAGNDKFEYFEKPWIEQKDISKLEVFWKSYENHINRFSKQPERLLKKYNP